MVAGMLQSPTSLMPQHRSSSHHRQAGRPLMWRLFSSHAGNWLAAFVVDTRKRAGAQVQARAEAALTRTDVTSMSSFALRCRYLETRCQLSCRITAIQVRRMQLKSDRSSVHRWSKAEESVQSRATPLAKST